MNTTEQFRQMVNQNLELFTQDAINAFEAGLIIEISPDGYDQAEWVHIPWAIKEAIMDLIATSKKDLLAQGYQISGWNAYYLGDNEDNEQEIYTITLTNKNWNSVNQLFDPVRFIMNGIHSAWFHAPNHLILSGSITFMIYR